MFLFISLVSVWKSERPLLTIFSKDALLPTLLSNQVVLKPLSTNQSPLASLLKHSLLGLMPKCLIQQVWGGVWGSVFSQIPGWCRCCWFEHHSWRNKNTFSPNITLYFPSLRISFLSPIWLKILGGEGRWWLYSFFCPQYQGQCLLYGESHSVMSDSLPPHGLYSPWHSPGLSTGVGSHSLLQGIFQTQ